MVFYIGKTERGLSRTKQHRHEKKNKALRAVIAALQKAGLTYEVIVLDRTDEPRTPRVVCWWNRDRDQTHLADLERWWIAMGRAMEWPLTNQTDGGEGAPNRFDVGQRSIIAKKAKAAMSPKQRSAAVVKANATRGPEQRKAIAQRAAATRVASGVQAMLNAATSQRNRTRTSEQNSENSRRSWSEERRAHRSAQMTAYMAKFTPEERRERARRSNALRTHEERSAAVRRVHAARTPEQRSEIVRKGHLARRRSSTNVE